MGAWMGADELSFGGGVTAPCGGGVIGTRGVEVDVDEDDSDIRGVVAVVAAVEEAPLFLNPNLIRTFPPTPIPAKVVDPPPAVPSVIPNSRPSTLRTASSPLLSKTFSCPLDSCSKWSRTSVRVAVGGNVPVSRIGGSEHWSAIVIGLEAVISPDHAFHTF